MLFTFGSATIHRVRLIKGVLPALFVACSSAACGARATNLSKAPDLAPPECSTAVANTSTLSSVHRTMTSVRSNPFGVVATPNGAWSFVAVGTSIAVFSDRSTPSTAVHQIPVPGRPLGEVLTHDGRYLLAADDTGAAVIDVAAAESGGSGAVVGMLTSPDRGRGGAIEVAISPDDRYAFVTLENGADVAVFNLARALTDGFGPSDFIGTVPLGTSPVGMAVSPDGHWLYATSEAQAGRASTIRAHSGTLSVVDLTRVGTDPAGSVVATVTAGCSPVRVITSTNGQVVWVTARGSDALLGFSASALVHNPDHALLADVPVGEAPVGLALVNNGRRIVVADSNRFMGTGASSNLDIVSTQAALAQQPSLLGKIPAGRFPREMAVVPHHNLLLVTNYASDQIETVNLADLP